MDILPIVIIESQRFPTVTDVWYEHAHESLVKKGYQVSRISVPQALDIPQAFKMLCETSHHPEAGHLNMPQGYLLFGVNYQGETTQDEHFLMLQQIIELQKTYPVITAQVCAFESQADKLQGLGKTLEYKVDLALTSLHHLINLQKKIWDIN